MTSTTTPMTAASLSPTVPPTVPPAAPRPSLSDILTLIRFNAARLLPAQAQVIDDCITSLITAAATISNASSLSPSVLSVSAPPLEETIMARAYNLLARSRSPDTIPESSDRWIEASTRIVTAADMTWAERSILRCGFDTVKAVLLEDGVVTTLAWANNIDAEELLHIIQTAVTPECIKVVDHAGEAMNGWVGGSHCVYIQRYIFELLSIKVEKVFLEQVTVGRRSAIDTQRESMDSVAVNVRDSSTRSSLDQRPLGEKRPRPFEAPSDSRQGVLGIPTPEYLLAGVIKGPLAAFPPALGAAVFATARIQLHLLAHFVVGTVRGYRAHSGAPESQQPPPWWKDINESNSDGDWFDAGCIAERCWLGLRLHGDMKSWEQAWQDYLASIRSLTASPELPKIPLVRMRTRVPTAANPPVATPSDANVRILRWV